MTTAPVSDFARWTVTGAVVPVLLLLAASVAAEPLGNRPLNHIRSADRLIQQTLEEGCRSSVTFREIVEELEQADVIVHLERTRRIKRGCFGQLQFVTAAGGRRYLRVSMDMSLKGPWLIAGIGHELHHAREVAREPEAIDEASFEALYSRIGRRSRGGYETEEATAAGHRILGELRAFATREIDPF